MRGRRHGVTVKEYAWVLGTRWRWDCACGFRVHGYTSEAAARKHAAEHCTKAGVPR